MGKSAIVIGAGIAGLAVARALAVKGYSVKVFERSQKAVGASIRNFGMIWPIGQPSGKLYEHAVRSRNIWKEISNSGIFWSGSTGSLHLAYEPDEWMVLQELFQLFEKERKVQLLAPEQIATRSEAAVQKNMLGGLFSEEELIVDPREAIAALPGYLHEQYGIDFYWGKCVRSVSENTIHIGLAEKHQTDIIFICSGTDIETLYPEAHSKHALTKCKLQMMRLAAQPQKWKIGPALCGGLSLIHYISFKAASSLQQLKQRFGRDMKEYLEWGIHVMVSQNGTGELTIGDSHEYGLTHDPFDKEFINKMIMDYLRKFAYFKDWSITETWNGLYTKHMNGDPYLFFSPDPGVYILNALGGAGMTLSFGLAEDIIEAI
ncbi:MAG: TIGR03364 family FAD-dependent oxidoreductase [Chitinophagaceae bacterium]|nr:TIGR03364 family FAD-dependent oxidoreductase [Chitinophagaceae bacterium]